MKDLNLIIKENTNIENYGFEQRGEIIELRLRTRVKRTAVYINSTTRSKKTNF